MKVNSSVKSTPSLAELCRFTIDFMWVRKRKERRKVEQEVDKESQVEETAHMDDYGDGVKNSNILSHGACVCG